MRNLTSALTCWPVYKDLHFHGGFCLDYASYPLTISRSLCHSCVIPTASLGPQCVPDSFFLYSLSTSQSPQTFYKAFTEPEGEERIVNYSSARKHGIKWGIFLKKLWSSWHEKFLRSLLSPQEMILSPDEVDFFLSLDLDLVLGHILVLYPYSSLQLTNTLR